MVWLSVKGTDLPAVEEFIGNPMRSHAVEMCMQSQVICSFEVDSALGQPAIVNCKFHVLDATCLLIHFTSKVGELRLNCLGIPLRSFANQFYEEASR